MLKDSVGAEPGGCTRDIVHRFYQEQYQIDGGKQDRYVTGSDAVGPDDGPLQHQGAADLPATCTPRAPRSTSIADHFFQAAFGGSFLNHQCLIAARAPLDTAPASTYAAGGAPAKNSVLDANGMPTSYPQYTATGPSTDDQLTAEVRRPGGQRRGQACGDFAVNTIQPSSRAARRRREDLPLIDDTKYPNIGDRLTGQGHLAGTGTPAAGTTPSPATPGRCSSTTTSRSTTSPTTRPASPAARTCRTRRSSSSAAQARARCRRSRFVKPYGAENEHPGYASESTGRDHLVDLLKTMTERPEASNTLVVVTYDEFGGQWDHVSPPEDRTRWGPGTRIPALVIARSLRTQSGVDHTSYDTTSILATIEHSYGLAPLSTRDAAVNDLSTRGGVRRSLT